MPAGRRVVEVRVELQAREVPEAAGGRDCAERAVEEGPGGDELVSVPAGLLVTHSQVFSETL